MNREDFINIYNPYRGKYVKKVPTKYIDDLFETDNLEWRFFNEPLRSQFIQLALDGIEIIAYFQRTFSNFLGLDIDDHTGTAWAGGTASYYLLDTYHSIIERLGFWPSILVQSPRGLHCYYFFDEKAPINTIEFTAKDRLSDLLNQKRIEIIPTATKALRIPNNKCFINPKTSESIPPPKKEEIETFPIEWLIDKSFRTTIKKDKKKTQRKIFQSLAKIENLERKYIPLIDGDTNVPFCHITITCRDAGFSIEQAVERFQRIVNNSILYNGEFKDNPKRLRIRISSIYKNKRTKKTIIPKCENYQYGLFDDLKIEKLISLDFPFQKQREKPVRRFLSDLLSWAEWHDEIKKDPVMFTYFDFLYKWYRKNRNEGLYPLPSNYLKSRNSHYTTIIAWLAKIGFLIPAPYQYSARLSICKYYHINWNLIEPKD